MARRLSRRAASRRTMRDGWQQRASAASRSWVRSRWMSRPFVMLNWSSVKSFVAESPDQAGLRAVMRALKMRGMPGLRSTMSSASALSTTTTLVKPAAVIRPV